MVFQTPTLKQIAKLPDMLLKIVIPALSGLLAAYFLLRLGGRRRWQHETAVLQARLTAGRHALTLGRFDNQILANLPAPVQRYFRAALQQGQARVQSARFEREGNFNLAEHAPARWSSFRSEQQVMTAPPGFDWNARIRMAPGLPVHVHDAYLAGQGYLHAALLGLLTLARAPASAELAEGELMRYLAEAAWYPTALLPGQGVEWRALDANSARATLTDAGHAVSLDFHFSPDTGLIERVYSPARPRMNAGQTDLIPWQGRFWDHAEFNGMQIPRQAEVAWLLPQGEWPYWRGRLLKADHTLAP